MGPTESKSNHLERENSSKYSKRIKQEYFVNQNLISYKIKRNMFIFVIRLLLNLKTGLDVTFSLLCTGRLQLFVCTLNI